MEAIVNKLAAQKNGVVFLSAPTNGGKTTIVREISDKKENAAVITSEEFLEAVIQPLKEKGNAERLNALTEYCCICIEDIDWYRGGEYTQVEFASTLTKLAEKALVIVTGIELKKRMPKMISHITHFDYYEKANAADAWSYFPLLQIAPQVSCCGAR